MKSGTLINFRTLSGSLHHLFSSYFLRIIPCCILFLTLTPLWAQQSKFQIEEQRAKVQEALIEDIFVISTTLVEADNDLPKHVAVRGYTMPDNHFIIRLPVDDWNGKSFLTGCGGGCGELPMEVSGKSKFVLAKGYATAFMNTGHWSPSKFDFSWAYNNPQAEKEYADRAIHETQRALKEISKVFYDRAASHSYFWGCSGGGRQALMSGSRYPKDFDGIIAEAPAINFTGLAILYIWLSQTNMGKDGKEILTREDIPLIQKAVYKACDELDGKADGHISSSKPCQFDPEDLSCNNEGSIACLSREKVNVLKKWYQGPVNSKGEKIFLSGVAMGSEPFWGLWLLGSSDRPFDALLDSESFVQNILFENDPGRQFSVFDFDFDNDIQKTEYMSNLLNVDRLSLAQYKDEGGKLLLFHGLADPAIPFQLSIDFYKKNQTLFGSEIDDFFRLFLIPGMDHCSVLPDFGITENSVDPIQVLEDWVEKKNPPNELPVIRYNNDGTVKSKFSVPMYVEEK